MATQEKLPVDIGKRRGRFWIYRELIDEQPDVAILVMSYMIVVRAECMFFPNKIEYIALSPLFQPVPQNTLAPEYEIQLKTEKADEDGATITEVIGAKKL